MNYKKTKETLDNLTVDLNKQFELAQKDFQKGNYENASKILAAAIGQANREVERAKKEELLPDAGLLQEKVTEQEIAESFSQVARQVQVLKERKNSCDKLYGINELVEEFDDALERKQSVEQKRQISVQYERSFIQLQALLRQREPYVGVKDELNLFLKQIKQMKADNAVSTTDLTRVMNAAYDRLTGGNKDKFDAVVNKMHTQHSLPLKLLGATLALLGAALVAAAIFFAPAVLAAASTGLAAAYLATGGVAAASSALSIGGAACFFKKTERMALADSGKELGAHHFENQHYTPVPVC